MTLENRVQCSTHCYNGVPYLRRPPLNMRHLDISPIIAPYKFYFFVYIKTLLLQNVLVAP